MFQFRIPYPVNPEYRQALFTKAHSLVSGHGTLEGTPERGIFQGRTIVGKFAGSYRALNDSAELEIEVSEKPWLVTHHMVEHEVRKLFAPASGRTV